MPRQADGSGSGHTGPNTGGTPMGGLPEGAGPEPGSPGAAPGRTPAGDAGLPAGVEQNAPEALLNRLRDASQSRGTPRVPVGRRAPAASRRRYSPAPVYGGRDPEGLGKVFNKLLAERGWNSPVAVGSVLARWTELVGSEIASHCHPESFDGTTVLVRCDSTAWATQLRLISPDLLRRFDAELGPKVVTRISVVGPAGPSWRKGGRSVKGRGPRDTYG